MLANTQVVATIPVENLSRAKEFYQDVLGLTPGGAFPNGVIMKAGKGTSVALFQRKAVKHEHTVAWFWVQDFDKTASELRNKGVSFEEFDYNTIGATNLGDGVYQLGKFKAAWFRDSEGNILNIGQVF